jgi:hypothetical protein
VIAVTVDRIAWGIDPLEEIHRAVEPGRFPVNEVLPTGRPSSRT